MLKRNNPKKNRALRKRVRAEKQRLRNRAKKHKPKKWYIITIPIESFSCYEALKAYAKEHHISIQRAIRIALKEAMNRWEQTNGRV